jgi:nicotinate phosphoribosyltransferase
MQFDVISTVDDPQNGEPLLQPAMRAGQRLVSATPLSRLREYAAAHRSRLPLYLRSLEAEGAYPVRVSPALELLTRMTDEANEKEKNGT